MAVRIECPSRFWFGSSWKTFFRKSLARWSFDFFSKPCTKSSKSTPGPRCDCKASNSRSLTARCYLSYSMFLLIMISFCFSNPLISVFSFLTCMYFALISSEPGSVSRTLLIEATAKVRSALIFFFETVERGILTRAYDWIGSVWRGVVDC